MKKLWSKILAREAKQPGSYSKRTLDCLSLMEKSDALAFETLCRFACRCEDLHPFVLDYTDEFYTSHGIDCKVLLHLANLGLITLGRMQTFKKIVPENVRVQFQTTKMHLTIKNIDNNEFEIGKLMFAQMGLELSQICYSEPINEFPSYLMEKWTNLGIKTRLEKREKQTADCTVMDLERSPFN